MEPAPHYVRYSVFGLDGELLYCGHWSCVTKVELEHYSTLDEADEEQSDAEYAAGLTRDAEPGRRPGGP
ncbi:MAG: hypothetical protein WB777_01740 [Mycobacterium sp.]